MEKGILVTLLLLTSQIKGSLAQTQSRDPENVRFYLYNNGRSGRFENGRELKLADFYQRSSRSLGNGVITKILIHGFHSNSGCAFSQELKNAYLRRGWGENIITVDWAPLANPGGLAGFIPGLAYPSAVLNVNTAGRQVGKLIEALVTHEKIPLRSIHVIGFSLGAHVAGTAGDYIVQKLQQRIARITGLDPAGPLFGSLSSGRRLSKFDANFVDIVHTNRGVFSTSSNLGNVDFFVNGGGPSQPGCSNESCSHLAAVNYYIQSIGNMRIYGCRCSSYSAYKEGQCGRCESFAVFGDGAQPGSPEGNYYLELTLYPGSIRFECPR